MNRRLFVTALLVSSALLAGCGKKEGGDEKTQSSGEGIGVEECDAYFKKVESCIGKTAPENKPAMEAALKANRQTWSDIAKKSQNKDGLKVGCKAALDAFVTSNPSCE